MPTSENRDNPYAAPLSVEPPGKKMTGKWGCFNVGILFLAAPMALVCLASFLLYGVGDGWQCVRSLLFIVGFVGMCFRQEWAYAIIVVMAVFWAVISLEIADAILANLEEEPPFPGVFILFFMGTAFYSAVVAVTSFFLAVARLIARRKNAERPVLQNDAYD